MCSRSSCSNVRLEVALASPLMYVRAVIQVKPTIAIDESEIQQEFIKAMGPGGQNVNKIAIAIDHKLVFNKKVF